MQWLKPSKTFLTALSLLILIEGCAGQLKPIPWIIDTTNGLCEPYVIIKDNPLTYARSNKPMPISTCNGFTALSPQDTAEALSEYRACQAAKKCN